MSERAVVQAVNEDSYKGADPVIESREENSVWGVDNQTKGC